MSPFMLHGPQTPIQPVLIAIPHAGRLYPTAMTRDCRLPLARLRVLEDRHADALAEQAFEQQFQGVVATVARGWIDLNRDPGEYDPGLVDAPAGMSPLLTRKVRGGLGVIPRRIGNGGEIWRHRIGAADFTARLATIHAPYHEAIEVRLAEIVARFGAAVLIDLHSMPSLTRTRDADTPDLVIGDLFGKAAAPWVSALAGEIALEHGFTPAINSPYAGGFTISRHARRSNDIHAVQIEIDRRLYLDHERTDLGSGLARVQRFVAELASVLAVEINAQSLSVAAE